MSVYELRGCGFESSCSHLNLWFHVCFKQDIDIQATIECGFSLKCLRDMIRAYSLLLILIVGLLLVLWFLLLLICTIFKIFCLVSQLHAVHISQLLLFHFFDYLVVSIISALPLFLALLAWFLFWLSLTAIIISPQFNVL